MLRAASVVRGAAPGELRRPRRLGRSPASLPREGSSAPPAAGGLACLPAGRGCVRLFRHDATLAPAAGAVHPPNRASGREAEHGDHSLGWGYPGRLLGEAPRRGGPECLRRVGHRGLDRPASAAHAARWGVQTCASGRRAGGTRTTPEGGAGGATWSGGERVPRTPCWTRAPREYAAHRGHLSVEGCARRSLVGYHAGPGAARGPCAGASGGDSANAACGLGDAGRGDGP